MLQIGAEELSFLTGGSDPYVDNVVLKKLFHPMLKLLLVTEALTVTERGAIPAMPTRDAVLQSIIKHCSVIIEMNFSMYIFRMSTISAKLSFPIHLALQMQHDPIFVNRDL
ncbi:hypothetical protein EJ110_NYTH00966 [Nymphaea thermarum]|nr:hypothetical protein EJ110_NYTH00966 [Nymphaea thermarum]